MSIRRRPNGTYQVRVSTPAGRVERSLPAGATRQDAKALENRLQSHLIDSAVGRKSDPLICDLLFRWLDGTAKSLKDYRKLVQRSQRMEPHYRGRTLSQISLVAESLTREMLASNRQPGTINRHLAILRRVANLAHRDWALTDQNFGVRVRLLREARGREVFLSEDQVRVLAAAAPTQDGSDFILLAALSGLRRGELIRLVRKDLVGDSLLVQISKSGKSRLVPLPPTGLEVARRCLPWKLSDRQLRREFETARAATGMLRVRFHDLRHTYASWLLSTGATTAQVRDLLGHSSIQTTDRYLHTDIAQSRAAVQNIGSGLGPKEDDEYVI